VDAAQPTPIHSIALYDRTSNSSAERCGFMWMDSEIGTCDLAALAWPNGLAKLASLSML
jgi:hypothetical protein